MIGLFVIFLLGVVFIPKLAIDFYDWVFDTIEGVYDKIFSRLKPRNKKK